jgi:hypothetical protein
MSRTETFPALIRDLVMKLEGDRRVSIVLANGRDYLAFARAMPDWLELYDDRPYVAGAQPTTFVALGSIVAIEIEPLAEE